MAGWTNRGKYNMFDILFRNGTEPTNFYVVLITNDTAPDADTNTVSDLTECAAGNGYTSGGVSLNRDAVDFDTLTEDDADDEAYVQIKNVSWTAAGGNIPSAGSAIRYAVLTDDNAVVANREIYAYWDLDSDRTINNGQTMTLADLQLTATE